jgi:hypothetical protein
MAITAFQEGHRVLYHWQRLDDTRLAQSLTNRTIYSSCPAAFNDPWDCKPYFNTEILTDPDENEKHVQWAVDLCRRRTTMSEKDIGHMKETLPTDRARAAALMVQMSEELAPQIAQRYRVYCLGPDVKNLLMWAHYADDHKGVCLEFSLRNDVMCSALKCEYLRKFPLMRAYARDDEDNLRMLLAKSEAWSHEREYRLIAQERAHAHAVGADTLVADNSLLKLPKGALMSVIVGCQGDYEKVTALVRATAPDVRVKRAVRVPNHYELRIEG